jgi:hypothetical protein
MADQPLRDVFLRLIPALPTPQPWQLVYQRMVPVANQPDANPVYAVDYDPTFEWFALIITVPDPTTIPATPWSNPIFTIFQSTFWASSATALAFSPDGGVTLYQSTNSPSFSQVRGAWILAQPLIRVALGAPGINALNQLRLQSPDNNARVVVQFEAGILPVTFQTQVTANVNNLNIAFAILKRLP